MKKLQSYGGARLIYSTFFLLSLVVSATAQFTDSLALFVVADDATVTVAETAIEERLTGMGFSVSVLGQNNVSDAITEGMSLILISATVTSGTVATNLPGLKGFAIPVINWEPSLYDDLGFQEAVGGEFSTTDTSGVEIVNESHPLAGGLAAGLVTIATVGKGVSYGVPKGDAVIIAVNSSVDTQAVLFCYEKNAAMFSGNAPARRVGTFLLNDVADGMSEEGWTLFDASVTWAMGGGTSTAVEYSGNAPLQFTLHNNYPNPFNPMTTIPYSIPEQANVRLSVFNVLGEKVETLVDEIKPAGNYTARFYASGISSGVYFYRLEVGPRVAVKRLILLK